MPAGDISSYALSIEFSLADKATPQLDLVDQRLGKVEQQITTIATKTMVSMQTITQQLNVTLTQMAQQYDKIQQSSLAGVKPLKDSSIINTEMQKKLTEESKLIDEKILLTWMKITKVLEGKAKQLTDETKIIDKEKESVNQVGKGMGDWSKQIESATRALRSHLKSLFDIKGAIVEAATASEMFKNANFRLYGSQTALVGRANQLALQYGIMRKEAMEAIAVLGNMKVPQEMLDKLTETTVKFNRLSGASIQTTAQWQKNLVAMGMGAADIERRMTHMAVAMRRFGLDTADVTAIMRTQQEQAQYLRNTFGDKTAGEIQRAQVAVAAFAKELGTTPEVAQSAAAALGEIEPWRLRQLGQMTGIAANEMKTAEGQTRAMAVASSNLAQRLRNTNDPMQRQALLMQAQAQYGEKLGSAIFNLAQQQTVANGKVRNAADAHRLMNDALNGHIGKVQNLNDIYAESNNTITAQLGLLKNAFFAAIGAIWARIEPAVIQILKMLNAIIYGIGRVLVTIGTWLDKLGPFGTAIKWVAMVVMIAVVAFWIWQAVLGSFGFAARVAANAGKAMGDMIEKALGGMGRGMQALAPHKATMLVLAVLLVAMGLGALLFALGVAKIAEHGANGIKALLGLTVAIVLMAIGLAYAGKIASGAAVGLLTLAVVLVAAGIGAYLMASAVQILVSAGTGALGALVMLGVVLVVLGYALIQLAIMATPAIPALFAVAVVLLIVAVAALILAVALVLAVDAMTKLDLSLAVQIMMFVLMMIVVAAIMIVAGAVLLVGAAVLLAAGVVLAVAGAMLLIGAMLIFLSGTIMLTGSVFLVLAGALLLISGPVLLLAGILLIVASPVLMAAGVLLIPAAIVLLIAGTILLAAATVIAAAGILIYIGGYGVLEGGKMLNEGAPLLNQAAWPLIKAGFKLAFAAPFLIAGAAPLAVAGAFLLVAGIGVFLGGLFLLIGATFLITGSTMLLIASVFMVVAGIALILAAPILFIGAILLLPAAIILFIAAIIMIGPAILLAIIGILLLIGGVGILLGGMMIKAGAWFLLGSGMMLMEAAPSLLFGALILVPAAFLLFIAGVLILIASIPFFIGSLFLLVGAAVFFVASLILAMGAIFFEIAVGTINPLAPEFLAASIMLLAAGALLIVAATLLMIGGAMMIPAAAVLFVAGIMLNLLSGPIIKASNKLLPAGERMMTIGEGFMMAGIGLLIGGQMMRESVWVLRKAGKELSGIAGELEDNLSDLMGVADMAESVGVPIFILGLTILWGGIMLYYGALWLLAASKKLMLPVLMLQLEGAWLLAASFKLLMAAWVITIASVYLVFASQLLVLAGTKMLRAISTIWFALWLVMYAERRAIWLLYLADAVRFGASMLLSSAGRLSAAANAILWPSFTIVYALNMLTMATLAFAAAMSMLREALMEPLSLLLVAFAIQAQTASIELFDSLDMILLRIETYANRMAEGASRIARAFRGILPTMPLGILGMNVIQSQSFATSQTRDSADTFYERHQKAEERQIQIQIRNKLSEVVAKLSELEGTVRKISVGGAGDMRASIGEIVSLLREHLPNVAKGQSSGLAHVMSEWMG